PRSTSASIRLAAMSGSDEGPAGQPPGEDAAAGGSGEAPGPRHGLPELIAERRAKRERLREGDDSAFPYTFSGVEPIAPLLAAYQQLADGEETDQRHRVAGRLSGRRGAGKSAFLDLVDRTGKVQLHARLDVLGEDRFQRLLALDLGDLIGVDGAAMRSRH